MNVDCVAYFRNISDFLCNENVHSTQNRPYKKKCFYRTILPGFNAECYSPGLDGGQWWRCCQSHRASPDSWRPATGSPTSRLWKDGLGSLTLVIILFSNFYRGAVPICAAFRNLPYYTVQYWGFKQMKSDNGGQECDTKTNYKVFLPVLWIRLHFFRIQDYGSGRPRLRIRQDRDPTWTFLWLLKK
jgi:hypothetical protein